MAEIRPPTIINSFLEHPVDKTGLQSPVTQPRTHENLVEQVRAKAATQPADQVVLSAEAMKAAAKPVAAKAPEPLKAPANPPEAQASQGKLPVDFLV
jgi:hypothetical protein